MLTLMMSVLGIIFVLLSVAFVTLLERHMLGVAQNRVGPNKVSVGGLVQPILDGIKLLSKEDVTPTSSNKNMYMFAPSVLLVLMLMEWCVVPKMFILNTMPFSLLFLLCLVGLMVYGQLLGGLASTSKYGYLGALRASAQSVSYEIVFTIILLSICNTINSFQLQGQSSVWYISGFLLWCIVVLVETGRTPYDFSEGESELVSGFNVDYSSVNFVLFFLSEYGSLIFFSAVTSSLFFNSMLLLTSVVVFLIITLRATLPRFRFDLLLSTMWVKVLPIVLVMGLMLII